MYNADINYVTRKGLVLWEALAQSKGSAKYLNTDTTSPTYINIVWQLLYMLDCLLYIDKLFAINLSSFLELRSWSRGLALSSAATIYGTRCERAIQAQIYNDDSAVRTVTTRKLVVVSISKPNLRELVVPTSCTSPNKPPKRQIGK
jgi:hypothetical protein